MEDVNYLMKYSSFWREGHSLITRMAEAHQEITWGQTKGMQALHTLWSLSTTLPLNHCSKTLQILRKGMLSFGGMSQVAPFPGKAIKLFFSISSKILSSRFSSTLAHRGWVFGMICSSWLSTSLCKNVCLTAHAPPSLKSYIALTFPLFPFGTVFRSYLKCCLLGCSPHFAPNKT